MPIGCGLALASQLRGEKRVTVTNFGDGASNIGAFHEALNLASVWKLPVIFVCQNNRYAEHTAFATGTSVARVADRAGSYSIPGICVDGNDPLAVYAAAQKAIARARDGGGPTLIEALTFRLMDISSATWANTFPKTNFQAALAADPYPRYRQWLVDNHHATIASLDALDAEVKAEVDSAVKFAFDSALTEPIEIKRDIYADHAI